MMMMMMSTAKTRYHRHIRNLKQKSTQHATKSFTTLFSSLSSSCCSITSAPTITRPYSCHRCHPLPHQSKTIRKNLFSSTHQPFSTHDNNNNNTNNNSKSPKDKYEHYRRYDNNGKLSISTQNDYLLYQELQNDTIQTFATIQEKLTSTPYWDDTSIQNLKEEIINYSAQYESHKEKIKELGPNGSYWYYSQWNGEDGIMTFLRSPTQTSSKEEEVVLTLNYHFVQPTTSMSLSVDEEYIVYLHLPLQGEEEIRVKHVSSGQEYILSITATSNDEDAIGSDGSGGSIAQVEFGCTGTGTATKYSIYYTTTNHLNQPCSVYQLTFDPSTHNDSPPTNIISKKQSTPVTIPNITSKLILHEPNTSNIVDISRTKGKQYMVIDSTSKTCNEIHLVKDVEDNDDGLVPLLVRSRQEHVKYHVECGDSDDDVILLMNCTHNASVAEVNATYKKVWVVDDEHKEREYDLKEEYTVFQTCVENLPLMIHPPSSSRPLSGLKILAKPPLVPQSARLSLQENGLDSSSSSSSGYFVEEIDLFRNYLVYYERSTIDGTQQIRVVHRSSKKEKIVPLFPSDNNKVESNSSTSSSSAWPKERIASLQLCGNIYYASTKLYFRLETPIDMGNMFEYDMENELLMCLYDDDDDEPEKETGVDSVPIPGTRLAFVQKRVIVPSQDGTNIPMTIIYPKQRQIHTDDDNNRQQQQPLLSSLPTVLLGYGSYGENQNLSYDPYLQPLLQRGFSVAYAHTRGGADLGQHWYHGGRGYKKLKAVEDYLACAEALVYNWDELIEDGREEGKRDVADMQQMQKQKDDEQQQQQRRQHRVVAKAFSAGGILFGAAMNQSPWLFSAATLINPYLDLMNTVNNPHLPLVEHEWEEWCGNGDSSSVDCSNPLVGNKDAKEFIQRYCPFKNLNNIEECPPMFLVGTLDDENVSFWHSVTYGKKLLDMTTSSGGIKDGIGIKTSQKEEEVVVVEMESTSEENSRHNVLIHIEENGGHHLHGRKLHVVSLEIAFLLSQFPK